MNALLSCIEEKPNLQTNQLVFFLTNKIYAPQNLMILQITCSSYFWGNKGFIFLSPGVCNIICSQKVKNRHEHFTKGGHPWKVLRLKFFIKVIFMLIWNCLHITFPLFFFSSIFRNMVRNVKLGHGLFDLIKTEQAAKVSILIGFLILSVAITTIFTCFEPFHNHKY